MTQRLLFALICVLTLLLAAPATAGPGLSFSLGEGIQNDDGNMKLSPLNAEIVPFFSVGIL